MNPREWFEDEDFWTAYAPLMFDEAHWAEVPAIVDAIERLAKPAPGAAVLDTCCGPGRHSLELASRGYRVTGIDITEAYLEAARASAGDDNPRFLKADIRDFSTDQPFDLAINLYTSFGYFSDPADDWKRLARRPQPGTSSPARASSVPAGRSTPSFQWWAPGKASATDGSSAVVTRWWIIPLCCDSTPEANSSRHFPKLVSGKCE